MIVKITPRHRTPAQQQGGARWRHTSPLLARDSWCEQHRRNPWGLVWEKWFVVFKRVLYRVYLVKTRVSFKLQQLASLHMHASWRVLAWVYNSVAVNAAPHVHVLIAVGPHEGRRVTLFFFPFSSGGTRQRLRRPRPQSIERKKRVGEERRSYTLPAVFFGRFLKCDPSKPVCQMIGLSVLVLPPSRCIGLARVPRS
jgi:hypothetical protein